MTKFEPLSTKDAVLGIGKKFSNEQLQEYVDRTAAGKPKDANKVKRDLKARLAKRIAQK